MSENKHTPEPWTTKQSRLYGNETMLADKDDHYIASIRANSDLSDGDSQDIARRIVACVNACAGIDTELLEIIADNDKTLAGVISNVEKQRDELLADLAEVKRSAEFNFEQYQDVGRLLHEECEKTEKLLAALEKCRKELSAWMRDHGDDIATQEAVADARAAIASVMGEQ